MAQTADMPDEQPWYSDGLCFSCTQCGNCCTGAPGVVWVDDDDIAEIAEYLGKSIGEVRLFHTRLVGSRTSLSEYANGDCTFFDPEKRTCRIYPVRPRQCRTWPFWQSNLDSRQSWEKTQQGCPGAGRGQFYSLEQIEQQASQLDI